MVIGDWAQSPKSIICNNTFIYKNKNFLKNYKTIKNNNKKSKLISIINSKNKNFKKKLLK
jgi:hypothetical protein